MWCGCCLRARGSCPQRPRLPRGHPRSTLRRCSGSRPGSGWDRVEPERSRPRTRPSRPHRHTCEQFQDGMGVASVCRGLLVVRLCQTFCTFCRTHAPMAQGWGVVFGCRVEWGGDPPSAMSTGRLRSVTSRPPPASQPGRLPGAFLLTDGETRLAVGFPLRCFQRFAHPNVATQRCRLPDNWITSGSSTPVLSY